MCSPESSIRHFPKQFSHISHTSCYFEISELLWANAWDLWRIFLHTIKMRWVMSLMWCMSVCHCSGFLSFLLNLCSTLQHKHTMRKHCLACWINWGSKIIWSFFSYFHPFRNFLVIHPAVYCWYGGIKQS